MLTSNQRQSSKKRLLRFLLALSATGIAITVASGVLRSPVAASGEANAPQDETLKKELTILKANAADQAHAMTDVDYHFSNLWFAGNAKNWPLADFYWKETVSYMKWAVRIIPVRNDAAGREIKLDDILQSILNSPFMQIGKAIKAENVDAFQKAYRFTLGGCYSCHKAAGKPYLRPQVPRAPASQIMNFDPTANWPN